MIENGTGAPSPKSKKEVTALDKRAQEYAEQCGAAFKEICAFDYKAGAKEEHILLTEWHDIEEDKVGLASDNAIDTIYASLPILVKELSTGEIYDINKSQMVDWNHDLYHHPKDYKWRKIHE